MFMFFSVLFLGLDDLYWLFGKCYKVFANFCLPAVGIEDFQAVVLQLAFHILGQEVGHQFAHEAVHLFGDLAAGDADVVQGVLGGKLRDFVPEFIDVVVGGLAPLEGLHHLQVLTVWDEEADDVHIGPAVEEADRRLDHQVTPDCHVDDGPVSAGGGVLVHYVHVLLRVIGGDVQSGGAVLGEDGGQGLGADRGGGLGGGEDV